VRNPGKLPWWHDVLIIVFLVALGVVGVAALWGDDIRSFIRDEPSARDQPPPASPPSSNPPIPGTSL
jgi:hypothetical protein